MGRGGGRSVAKVVQKVALFEMNGKWLNVLNDKFAERRLAW
jgi:hypothetical protein